MQSQSAQRTSAKDAEKTKTAALPEKPILATQSKPNRITAPKAHSGKALAA